MLPTGRVSSRNLSAVLRRWATTLAPGAGGVHGASPTAADLQSHLPVAELAAHLKRKAGLSAESGASVDGGLHAALYL